jgi:predicted nucleotidyltransferase
MVIDIPPGLAARFAKAIKTAASELAREFGKQLCGILVGGSVARGKTHEHSDVDLFVLTDLQRVQRRRQLKNGVLVDFFLSSRAEIDRQMTSSGSHVIVRNYAEGFTVYDRSGVVRDLHLRAKQLLQQPRRAPTAEECFTYSHRFTDRMKDFSASLSRGDEISANFHLFMLIQMGIESYYLFARRWQTSPKAILADMEIASPCIYANLIALLNPRISVREKEPIIARFAETVRSSAGFSSAPAEGPVVNPTRQAARILLPNNIHLRVK